MRWITMLSAAFLLTAVQPALAYQETQPGEGGWPEIPGRTGLRAFLGTWFPQCNVGVFSQAKAMTVHDDGRITYVRNKALPVRYRVIETTPYYVLTLVQALDGDLYFWAFRPLDHLYADSAISEMISIGVNECQVYGDAERKHAIWNFGDDELLEFWRTNKFCHPSLTQKIEGGSYWGGDWGQACWFDRRNR